MRTQAGILPIFPMGSAWSYFVGCKVHFKLERDKTRSKRKSLLSCKGQKELITAGKWALLSTQRMGEREKEVP